MQNSGTKLVLLILGVALLLGITSWWYRYGAAHRASQFWGSEASRLIAESEGLEGLVFEPIFGEGLAELDWEAPGVATDLSKVRGQAHLRHALLSDGNFDWEEPIDSQTQQWSWCFRFFEGPRSVLVVISEDLQAIGKYQPVTQSVSGYRCEAMTASLKQYFDSLPIEAESEEAASTDTE